MPAPRDVLFGKIAIRNRLVDEAKIKRYLVLLDRAGGSKALGRVLLEKGEISESQYRAIQAHVEKLAQAENGGKEKAPAKGSAAADPPPIAPAERAAPAQDVVRVEDVRRRDFSHLAGKPVDEYLQVTRKLGASDLHFQVDAPPFLRLHGSIVYLKHPVLTREVTEPALMAVLDDEGRETFRKHNDFDFCYESEHGRYRAAVLRQRKGVDGVFRVIPDHVPTLEELHLPETLRQFTKYRQGIVLLTGPSGCGKTATMAALVDIINQEQQDHIVTVEEPIEYIVESKRCNVNQRHVRKHTETFASALRSAMRSDPDYICVGEMRDLETVSMAITAAETGHLVLGTLHTTNAIRSVDRIIDIFPPKEQEQIRAMVSESMRGVISQKLLPRADGLGREPALEVLFCTPAVGNIIRERKTFQLTSVIQTGARQGMIGMDDSIEALLKRKIVTRETARFHAEDKSRFPLS